MFPTEGSDKRALRKQCRIPKYATLTEYRGYPPMVGFGQREGLHIEGRFQLSVPDAERFQKEALSKGWERLPISEEIRGRIRFKFSVVNLDTKSGFYRCHTAGDNVLYASSTLPISSVAKPIDIIISIYDSNTNQICAAVASGY